MYKNSHFCPLFFVLFLHDTNFLGDYCNKRIFLRLYWRVTAVVVVFSYCDTSCRLVLFRPSDILWWSIYIWQPTGGLIHIHTDICLPRTTAFSICRTSTVHGSVWIIFLGMKNAKNWISSVEFIVPAATQLRCTVQFTQKEKVLSASIWTYFILKVGNF